VHIFLCVEFLFYQKRADLDSADALDLFDDVLFDGFEEPFFLAAMYLPRAVSAKGTLAALRFDAARFFFGEDFVDVFIREEVETFLDSFGFDLFAARFAL